jgi:hypothetical protein
MDQLTLASTDYSILLKWNLCAKINFDLNALTKVAATKFNVLCPGTKDIYFKAKMKSQDIVLLLKLASLSHQERGLPFFLESKWEDWDPQESYESGYPGLRLTNDHSGEMLADLRPNKKTIEDTILAQYSVRALADSTGISKSEVSLALQRCYEAGLAKPDRINRIPRVNANALSEFIIYGLKYVFPVKPAEITRGIATAWAAPVLQGQVMSAGELVPVWPDARGHTRGQAITPLFKSVPYAVRHDPRLYSMLALTDAVRIGQSRERKIASENLSAMLKDA